MVKSELIAMIAEHYEALSPKEVEYGVNSITHILSDALTSGDRIEIRGFGSYCLHYRKPRNAHNPKTGTRVRTKPKYRPHFKAGKALRQRVNANREIPLNGKVKREQLEEEFEGA